MSAALALAAPLAEFIEKPFDCPDCGGEGIRTMCPMRCDGSHVFDVDQTCGTCWGEGVVAFTDPSDDDIPEEVAA